MEIDEIRVLEEERRKKEEERREKGEERRKKEEANEMRRKILQWLSPDDCEETTHERHFQKRFKNTGQWLLEDSRFKNWRDEVKSGLLWCYGARKSQLYINLCALIRY